jgi:outer membrane immunogenic protein
MKRLTLTCSVLCAFCTWTYAGPEPISSGKEVTQAVAPQTSCFEGWYFGIHGGGLLSNFDNRADVFEETIAPNNATISTFASGGSSDNWGGEGGFHAGYNWQRGHWIFGLEADVQGSNFSTNSEATAVIVLPPGSPFLFTTDVTAKAQVDMYSTARLRVGYTIGDRIMVFGTGGGAFGLTEFKLNSELESLTPADRGLHGDFESRRNLETRGGWTAGGGFDFCLNQHWILSFTYLYVDLGDRSANDSLFAVSTQGRTYFADTHAATDFKYHVFQGGLTFHF